MSKKEIIKKQKICKVLGCNKLFKARSLCHKHYSRERNKGAFTTKKCIIEGCESPGVMNKMCTRHDSQIKIKGYIFGNPAKGRRHPNDFIISKDYVEIKLCNMQSNYVNSTFIDIEDFQRVKQHKWHLAGKGYVESRINKKLVKLHQFVTGRKFIDHRDQDPLNNRKNNLRRATQSQQLMNQKSHSETGFRGVEKHNKKYAARIKAENKRYFLGTFETKKEAAIAYNKGALKYHGEFACLNNI